MKIVYLAAPYRGATPEVTAENVARVKEIARRVAERGYLPFVPHLAISYCSDDPKDWSTALHHGLKWVEVCDEVWIVGDVTEGVADEIAFAKGKGIPVVYRVDEDGGVTLPRAKRGN